MYVRLLVSQQPSENNMLHREVSNGASNTWYLSFLLQYTHFEVWKFYTQKCVYFRQNTVNLAQSSPFCLFTPHRDILHLHRRWQISGMVTIGILSSQITVSCLIYLIFDEWHLILTGFMTRILLQNIENVKNMWIFRYWLKNWEEFQVLEDDIWKIPSALENFSCDQ